MFVGGFQSLVVADPCLGCLWDFGSQFETTIVKTACSKLTISGRLPGLHRIPLQRLREAFQRVGARRQLPRSLPAEAAGHRGHAGGVEKWENGGWAGAIFPD